MFYVHDEQKFHAVKGAGRLSVEARRWRPSAAYHAFMPPVNAFMQAVNPFMQAINAFMQAQHVPLPVNAFMQAVNPFMQAINPQRVMQTASSGFVSTPSFFAVH